MAVLVEKLAGLGNQLNIWYVNTTCTPFPGLTYLC